MTGRRRVLAFLLLPAVLAACGSAAGEEVAFETRAATASSTTTTVVVVTAPPTTAPPAPTAAPTTRATTPPTTKAPRPPRPRVVHEQAWTPYAVAGPVVLRHPSRRVERVGFHQSNHDGARQQDPLPTAADPITMEGRDTRSTSDRTAADIVADPDVEIRSPVTGTVLRAGTYVLYCDHRDDYVVIEPDDRPGWEVKLLHIDGVRVGRGDRVVAGETVLAPRPTRLPFESQVDEFTAPPAWPHVHVEVVDPSIPDRPNGPGC
jgi:hypothetical protein